MIKQEQYINLEKETVNAIIKLNDCKQVSLFLYICLVSTYKFKIFGVYKKQTYQTLMNSINEKSQKNIFKEINEIKRAVKQLEKKDFIKILIDKNELIFSLEEKIQDIESLIKIIEHNASAFNLSAIRLEELSKTINISTSIKIKQEKLQDDFYFEAEQ